MKVSKAVAVAEQRFHQVMAEHAESGNGFDLPKAMLLGIDVNGDDVIVTPEVAAADDIYLLLQTKVAREAAKRFTYVALVTCGWAAPIVEGHDEPEVAPSEHAQRRRVRLFVAASAAEVASVLRFQDDADEQVLDEGQAKGPLAEAVQRLFR